MSNLFKSVLIVVMFTASVFAQDAARYEPVIITTTTDLAAITRAITGKNADVRSLMPTDADADFVIPQQSAVFRAEDADVFFRIGADLEDRWIRSFYTKIKNGDIKQGASSNIIVSTNIALLKTVSAEGTTPMVHKAGNPYVWLDPLNGKIIAKQIADYLTVMFPQWQEEYRANLNQFLSAIDAKMPDWQKKMEPYKDKKFIAYAQNFNYLAKRFGLNIVDYVQPAPGIPPTGSRIDVLIEKIKKESVPYMIVSNNVNPQKYQRIVDETGITLITLPQSVGVEWVEDYIQLFDYITGEFHRTRLKAQNPTSQNQ